MMAFQVTVTNVTLLLLVGGLVHLVLDAIRKSTAPRGSRFPPNPPSRPILGNLAEVSSSPQTFLLLHNWYKDLKAPLYRFSILGKNTYVINTAKAASDLLVLRSATFSSRPSQPSVAELIAKQRGPAALPYDPKRLPERTELWRRHRKFLHQHLSPTALDKDTATHEIESLQLARDIGRAPSRYSSAIERCTDSIMFRVMYGQAVHTGNEHFAMAAKRTLEAFIKAFKPGAYLVDLFPSMMLLPAFVAPWKRYLADEGDFYERWNLQLLDQVRDEMARGRAPPTIARAFLEDQDKSGMDYVQGAALLGATYTAGSPTTSATIQIVLLALVHHPEWAQKTHEELDRVVGPDSVPGFKDLPNLPVLRAVVVEAQRWRPIPALPKSTVEDTVYDGLFIPRDSFLITNTWSIFRDEETYPDAEAYNPSRWLSPGYPTYKEPLSQHPSLHNFPLFGYGRRICPGQTLAERSIMICVARILWAYRLSKARDENGVETPVHLLDFEVPMFRPNDFAFDLTPWDGKRLSILDEALQRASALDPIVRGRA